MTVLQAMPQTRSGMVDQDFPTEHQEELVGEEVEAVVVTVVATAEEEEEEEAEEEAEEEDSQE